VKSHFLKRAFKGYQFPSKYEAKKQNPLIFKEIKKTLMFFWAIIADKCKIFQHSNIYQN